MPKVIYCGEVGFDCDGKVSVETEEEVVAKVAKYAMEVHGLQEITPRDRGQVQVRGARRVVSNTFQA